MLKAALIAEEHKSLRAAAMRARELQKHFDRLKATQVKHGKEKTVEVFMLQVEGEGTREWGVRVAAVALQLRPVKILSEEEKWKWFVEGLLHQELKSILTHAETPNSFAEGLAKLSDWQSLIL